MRKVKMNDYKRFWDNKNRRWVYKHRVVASKILGKTVKEQEKLLNEMTDVQWLKLVNDIEKGLAKEES
jgi:hypothetical protein